MTKTNFTIEDVGYKRGIVPWDTVFTVEDVLDAYQKTGIKPCRKGFGAHYVHVQARHISDGCGLTALALAHRPKLLWDLLGRGEILNSAVREVTIDFGMTPRDRSGFIFGFDGEDFDGETMSPDYYKLGARVGQILFMDEEIEEEDVEKSIQNIFGVLPLVESLEEELVCVPEEELICS